MAHTEDGIDGMDGHLASSWVHATLAMWSMELFGSTWSQTRLVRLGCSGRVSAPGVGSGPSFHIGRKAIRFVESH